MLPKSICGSLILYHGRAGGVDCRLAQQFLRQIHQPVIIRVCLIKLEHREFGIVLRRDSFVSKIPVDLVDPLDSADHQALQIQLGRDAQIQIHVERVVMRNEGPRGRATVNRLQHRRFYFQETTRLQLAAQRSDDLRSRDENFANLRVGDQIQVALAVADLDVFQAVPLFGHGKQRLGHEIEPLHMHAQLTGLGPKQIALGGDNVADFQKLVESEIVRWDGVFSYVDLQALAVLR